MQHRCNILPRFRGIEVLLNDDAIASTLDMEYYSFMNQECLPCAHAKGARTLWPHGSIMFFADNAWANLLRLSRLASMTKVLRSSTRRKKISGKAISTWRSDDVNLMHHRMGHLDYYIPRTDSLVLFSPLTGDLDYLGTVHTRRQLPGELHYKSKNEGKQRSLSPLHLCQT
ncbi:hypothetical protein BDV28DRAFT_91835 [Aspergillus coremiiformis]|uniref:Uncharacterized protein n=1 Tax=Aspergillus coremiiformis TaxID=138285 RepID=A0A5N6ZBL4_9EURO|nr:hypothetical protein BDV28DRAFT_91835 [Aspergillus coremiiformis]